MSHPRRRKSNQEKDMFFFIDHEDIKKNTRKEKLEIVNMSINCIVIMQSTYLKIENKEERKGFVYS